MKKRIWSKAVSIFTAILLVVGIVPNTTITALAAEEIKLFIGGQQITESGCYENKNGTWTKVDGTEPANGQFSYDADTFTLTLNGATIQEGTSTVSVPYSAGIYAQCNSGESVSLTIELIGENTITGYYGIYVNAEISVDSNGTDASLTITGENNGSLEVSGSNHGIFVKSGTGNASLNIEKATVTSSTNGGYAAGVCVQSSANATGSPNISLSVNGGSLTASGTGNSDGILFYVGQSQATGATTSLTITDHAIVDARNGGISASRISETLPTPTPTGNNSSGIVFDGKNGTVYGDVTLQEDITISEGESLTIEDGASLNTGNNKVIVNGGTLNGEDKITGTVKYAPSITTESLPEGKVSEEYSTSLSANGSEPITWNVTDGNLPTGLSLSTNGKITGTPTAPGEYFFTATASNDVGSVSKELTIHVKDVDPIYSIQNSGDISFVDTLEGYTPEVKTIMITNDGNQPITLNQPVSSESFEVGTLSKTTLSVGETAEFTVQPKTGLLAGSYDEDIKITGTNNGKSVSTTVNVKFNVKHNAVKVERKDPTCTENGNIEYWYCEACRKYFQDEALTKELKQEETIIKAKGHNAVKTEEKLATCTEDGNIEYWYCDVCKKYFSDAEFKNEISFDKTVIPATGHNLTKVDKKNPTIDAAGNTEYWYCEVCDKYFSDEKAEHEITLEDTVIAKLPKLISGANQEWTKGNKDGLTFKVDTDINEFKKVLVDGKELKDTDYDIKSGSTILTLKPSFLDTLSAGKHQIRLEFNNGTIEAYFTVKVKETTTVPETGEQTNLYLWAMLAIASSASILVLRRYKKYNR